jgi:hypothetical protein
VHQSGEPCLHHGFVGLHFVVIYGCEHEHGPNERSAALIAKRLRTEFALIFGEQTKFAETLSEERLGVDELTGTWMLFLVISCPAYPLAPCFVP